MANMEIKIKYFDKEIDKIEFERVRDDYRPVIQLVNKGISE